MTKTLERQDASFVCRASFVFSKKHRKQLKVLCKTYQVNQSQMLRQLIEQAYSRKNTIV